MHKTNSSSENENALSVSEIDGLIRFPDSVCILAENDENKIILVSQYRESKQGYTLELPGGKIETGERVTEAATRELFEETGIISKKINLIISLDMDFSKSIHRTHVTHTLCSHREILKGNGIKPIRIDLHEAIEKIAAGEISHAATVVGLRWLEMTRMRYVK